MKKWHRACLAGAGLASSLVIGYQSTRTEDVLTPQDVAAWQATGALHATSKPPVWRDFGLFLSLGLTGVSGWNLWRLLETEDSELPPREEGNNQPPITPNFSPSSPHNSNNNNSNSNNMSEQPQTVSIDSKQELWQQLNQPGAEWVIRLLQPGPLLIWGGQSSSKTTTANFIALLRVIFCDHKAEVNDPHAHLNNWAKYFQIYGQNCNYQQIEQRLSAYYDRVKNPTGKPYTAIWDEVTQYAENCSEDLAGRFLKSILADTRKIKEHPILLSHNNTLGALAGGKGGAKQMQIEGMVELHLFNKRGTYGDLAPAMRGILSGLELDKNGIPIEQQIELQNWMTADYIYQLFPELAKQLTPENTGDSAITDMPNLPKMSQQRWDYWVSESTDDEINNLIDSRRLSPNNNLQAEIHAIAPLSPESLSAKPLSQSIDASRFSELYPETTEEGIMEAIYRAVDSSLKPAEIVRTVLKCTSSQPGSNRHYSEVGKPVFCYLIRKHGTAALIAHFAEFLDKSQS
ncbi:hypothetical protein [Kamptonema sp. UHCC 0994]|uniref:hypothetical protein n=1 Tax=Kamptonema sp. UHCC 0994 TaxID=3031329 RepID=UPI0023BB103F|nr:hypothetical protein [Kamptonema sp. UHCC 0994]MDF0556568.1 hypothetical protein [Kamptonema sp. UHCC 0994]